MTVVATATDRVAPSRGTHDHGPMPSLGARERAKLPDRAFAYIDSQGRRVLPIHDAAHVRNALARFSRVSFEDDEGRDRARMRLLKAAQRHGIMPLGFVGAQLRPEQNLPRGQVTFALTDVEASTELVHRLGDGYGAVLNQLRRLLRAAVQQAGGREVDARGDELFAAFARPAAALDAAVAIQRGVRGHGWGDGVELRVRIGIHTGRPSLGASWIGRTRRPWESM
jgi:class 3 adenylate cyclase